MAKKYGEYTFIKDVYSALGDVEKEVIFCKKAGLYEYKLIKYKTKRDSIVAIINQINQFKDEIKEIREAFPKDIADKTIKHFQLINKIKKLRNYIRGGKFCAYEYFLKRDNCQHNFKIIDIFPAYDLRRKLYYIVRQGFSDTRRSRSYLNYSHKRVENYFENGKPAMFQTCGGVHIESGAIRKTYLKKKIKKLFEDKKPENKRANYVGVELEFCATYDKYTLGEILYNEGLLEYCKWTDDHSLRPKSGENRHELAILIKESEINTVLKKICRVVEDSGAVAEDRRCGLHVHLDCRKRDKETVYNNLVACQRWFMKMSPPSRRDSEFCRKVATRAFPKSFNGGRSERYRTVNAASFYRHKTIEVRTHEGTVSVSDVVNWVNLLVKIARRPKKVEKMVPSIKKMVDTFKINDKLEEYVRDRINYWNVNSPRPGRIPFARDPEAYEISSGN